MHTTLHTELVEETYMNGRSMLKFMDNCILYDRASKLAL